jgi:hypothetical protein
MLVQDNIRVIEDTDDPAGITFGGSGESTLPILQWLGPDGWLLFYLDAYGEINDYRVAGAHNDIAFAVSQAREHLDGPYSQEFPQN